MHRDEDADTAWIHDAFAPSADVEIDMIESSVEVGGEVDRELDAMLASLRPLDVVITIGDPAPPPPREDDIVTCEVAGSASDDEPTLVPWDSSTGVRPVREEITVVRRSESARHEAARINAHVVRRSRPPTPMTPPIQAASLPALPATARPRLRLGRGTRQIISETDPTAPLRMAGLRAPRPAITDDELRFDRDLAHARPRAETPAELPRIAVARRASEPVAFPSAWAELDPRIAAMLPSPAYGTVERVAEHAALDGRIVTRELVLVLADLDPLPAIERLGAEIARAGLRLEIDDRGIGAASPELSVHARGDEQLELTFQLVTEHDDVDLRDEMMRCDYLRPLLPLAELGRFVTRVGSGRQLDRAPHAAMSIALDDETRPCLHAWLAARDYRSVGSTWKLSADGFEYVVAFERSEELGVDEATAFVRPIASRPAPPARTRARADHVEAAP